MANNGSIQTNQYNTGAVSLGIALDWNIVSPDSVNSTSYVYYKVYTVGSGTNWITCAPINANLDGKNVYSLAATSRTNLRVGTVLKEGYITVQHNSEGVKTGMTASIEAAIYSSAVNCRANGQWDLDTIPRASDFNLSGNEIGKDVVVAIKRNSTAFSHKVVYKFGNRTVTVTTSAGDSCVIATPMDLCSEIPTATSDLMSVEVTTYSGSTQIGNMVSKQITLAVPESVKPTINSIVLSGVKLFKEMYLNSYSMVNIKSTFNGVYGSTIKKVDITGSQLNYSTTGINIPSVDINSDYLKAGTHSYFITVTDTRGRSVQKESSTINVVDYSKPTIEASIQRCIMNASSQYVDDDVDGTILKITPKYKFSELSGQNSLTIKKAVSNNLVVNLASSGTAVYLGSNGSFSTDQTYIVTFTLVDEVGLQSNLDVAVDKGQVIISFHQSGEGVGIGEVAEQGQLRTKWPIYVAGKKLEFNINSIYPIGSIYITVNAANPSTLFPGTTWSAFAQGRTLIGVGTNSYGVSYPSVNALYGAEKHAHAGPSHTHTGPSHTHTLGAGYAMLNIGNGVATMWFNTKTAPARWSENEKANIATAKTPSLETSARAIALGGNTDTSGTAATGYAGTGATTDTDSKQPSITVYMWQRIA